MNRSTLVSLLLMVAGGGFLVFRGMTTDMGSVYVRVEQIPSADGSTTVSEVTEVDPSQRDEEGVEKSFSRTFGIWVSALLTLSILSFLWGDNVLYKIAEAIFVGSSAAYAMVVAFWTELATNLFGKLMPGVMQATFLPGMDPSAEVEWIYLVPLALSVLMLWRLAPRGAWVARWPLAFFIGATAGIRMVAYFESDFVAQLQSSIIPLILYTDGRFDIVGSIKNAILVLGLVSALVYFFFSIEHEGVVGRVSRIGIWVLMITFGTSFAYTVMGRIALLAQRLEFLFDDWLWFIDPGLRRIGM